MMSECICPLCNQEAYKVEPCPRRTQLRRCDHCSLVYACSKDHSPFLYDTAYDDGGDYQYYHNIAVNRANQLKMHVPWPKRVFFRKVKSKGKLLDVGCSTGSFLLAAKNRGWDVSGLEISPRAAQIARDLTDAKVWATSIEEFTHDELYDAVTAWEVLEHIVTPKVLIENSSRLLRSGGYLALSVPNWRSPWMKRSLKAEHWPPYHLTFWERETLKKLLESMGLVEITIVDKPFAWGEEVGNKKWFYFPVSIVRSLLLDQKGMHLVAIARKL